jgi:hypothetical protein
MEAVMTLLAIEFNLSAEVNGESFEMNGTGVGDRATGTCELHLNAAPAFPKGFDPVSCPLICSHPTSTFFAKPLPSVVDMPLVSRWTYAVSPAREGVIRDAANKEVLRLKVSGRSEVIDRRLIVTSQMKGTSHLPALNRTIAPLDDYILPSGPGRATGIVRYQLETKDGEILDGVTTIPYLWTANTELEWPLVRHIHMIDVAWDGRNTVSAYYRLSVGRLAEANIPSKSGEVRSFAA